MRILVLAGGIGTRLKPLTTFVPKVMMSVHGHPFLYYLVKAYQGHDLVLSVNYMKESVKNWCRLTKTYLEFVEEPEFMGTGGAIRIAEPFMYGRKKFAVVNGDTYIEEDMNKIFKSHNSNKDIATVVYAKDMLDNKMRNSGVYVFSQKIFDYLRKPKVFTLEDKLDSIPHKIYESKKKYLDIGTYKGLTYAKTHLFNERKR